MKKALPISLRFLLLGFVPIAVALIGGFHWFRSGIEENVRGGLERSLVEAQRLQTDLRLDARRQRLSLLATLAENSSLKAVISLVRESPQDDAAAQRTVQDQLLEMASSLDADVVGFRDGAGKAVAAVARTDRAWYSMPVKDLPGEGKEIAEIHKELFELATVPVNTGSENLGMLVVGKRFHLAGFHRQAVLLRQGQVAGKTGVDLNAGQLAAAFRQCKSAKPCAVTLDNEPYLALSVDSQLLEQGYSLWTLHSVEQASSQLLGSAKNSFWAVLVGMLFAALLADLFGVRAVTRPLVNLVERLRESERSGVLHGDFPETSSTLEVNELARAFNLAAQSVAESQKRLDETYLQITQTMAQTLDARDPYTAGHSSRVSDYAVAIAHAMELSAAETEIIRVGANLHDIGKIGIPDAVLQKPGALTDQEFEVIKKHPVIGKRILEGVAKFRDYLSIVELHHENQDGSGYPWGLRGENVPLSARIVHVVDAYDAMTSNRPYRNAMQPEKAQDILRRNAGTQFDPAVVEVFLRLVQKEAVGGRSTAVQLASLERSLEEQESKVRVTNPVL